MSESSLSAKNLSAENRSNRCWVKGDFTGLGAHARPVSESIDTIASAMHCLIAEAMLHGSPIYAVHQALEGVLSDLSSPPAFIPALVSLNSLENEVLAGEHSASFSSGGNGKKV